MDRIDQTTITHKGVTFEVILTADIDASPHDADCYTEADIAAWKNDEWRYVGVSIVPIVDHELIEQAARNLGGVEWGTSPGFSVTTAEIAKRAVDDGWCDEVMANLRAETEQRGELVDALNARIDKQVAALFTYNATKA